MPMLSSSSHQQRKAKVNLSDYPFRRDIDVRLFMARLSVIEVEVLREIIHHSLKISVEQLAEDAGIELEVLLPILDKLSAVKLFQRQHSMLIVDKEMRKYFEGKIEKFDDEFKPNIDFLQSVLNKVPIHVLPLWYAIPRSSDNIFESIIEKYFLTPSIYQQYLNELQFDNPVLKSIIHEVYQPPNFTVTADGLMRKFNLTHEQLEEHLLLLEYHFVCCLSYKQTQGYWQEIVTPFAEWHEFLQFEYQTKPKPLSQNSIKKDQSVEFGFVKDLATLLQACKAKKVLLKNVKGLNSVEKDQQQSVIDKLLQLEFAELNGAHISATLKGKEWLALPLFEQIAAIANDPLNHLSKSIDFSSLWNGRNLRLIEKSLKRLTPNEWVDMDCFLQGMIAPIGDKEPITLKNKGKKWRYVLPLYTDYEKLFIETVIHERLAELGMIETGTYENKRCFCLTPFGNHAIH